MVIHLRMMGWVMLRAGLLLAFALLLVAPPAGATEPAVARPSFPIGGEIQTRGVVFFVKADVPGGAAAVGTAHTFDLGDLVKVKRGDLTLGHSRRVVAQTSGFLVQPGRPYGDDGGFAEDYFAYRLDARPSGVRVLDIAKGEVASGARVRILGVPASVPRDEDDLFGSVRRVTRDRVDVELDVPFDLRGWGGAPVLDATSGEVIGILQANDTSISKTRVVVAPMHRLRSALAKPLLDGRGRPFASFALHANSPQRRRAAKPASTRAQSRDEPLMRQGFEQGPRLFVDVEYPGNGAVVGDSSCGAFVSGRATALHGELKQFDVMLVLDTSLSTADPSGADVNGNGVVGKSYLGGLGSVLMGGSSDKGDSILAAEVAAARQLLKGLDPRSTRVGVAVFSGQSTDHNRGIFVGSPEPPAITLQPLTNDFVSVEQALDSVLIRGAGGNTHMAAGLDQATQELKGLRGARSEPNPRSDKIVLFFTDGQPTLPYGASFARDNVQAVIRAANRAGRAGIQVHSFAIGPDALDGPIAVVQMATLTDGFFTPVRHPGDLVDVVEEVSFANLENVQLRSATTGDSAAHFRATADGSWAGFVKLKPGKNTLEVKARTTDGLEKTEKFSVTMREGAPEPPLPDVLVVARNRLLEDCLRALKQVRVEAEAERAEEVRKRLLVEIEKEREAARKRAEEQRKRLEIDVEDDADSGRP